jgi:secreted Zn-dependent insulinase-like peptidase
MKVRISRAYIEEFGSAEHVQEILDFTFQYIRLLQHDGVVEWFFEEVKVITRTYLQNV